MNELLNNIVGKDGTKFDITVDLSRSTLIELFAMLLVVAIIAVALNVLISKAV